MDNEVKKFLKRFHDYPDNVDKTFTEGCCYWFAVILQTRFKNSELMYDEIANHFCVLVNNRLYDITGDVTDKYNVIRWSDLDDDLLRERIIRDCINF